MSAPPFPRATYRLQFNKAFRFDDGHRLLPYLAEMGVSHVYASPVLMARPGSAHGYDIVDHSRFNPEIGDRRDFDRFVDALHEQNMGLILDFVPNHMGVGPDNAWWIDVLEWGKASPCARYFDIDWQPFEPTLAGRVLLPVLGDHYGAILERGELQLEFDAARGAFSITYFEACFPVNPRGYAALLHSAGAHCPAGAEAFESLAGAFRESMKGRSGGTRQQARRARVSQLKRDLAGLVAGNAAVKAGLAAAIRAVNGAPGRAGSFDSLHRLLEQQAYRLAFWRVAAHEMNYRRFFDINDLAGLRMEQPELFDASHALVGRLMAEERVQGLRLDHVDGLRDPRGYIERLHALAKSARPGATGQGAAKRAGTASLSAHFYVVVEKILAPHETLRKDWRVSGTSGYEFMSTVNGLFVDPAAEQSLQRGYSRFVAGQPDFAAIRIEAKRLIMRETLGSELNVLANRFNRVAKQWRDTRDYSFTGLRHALSDVIANFPVYRTYVTAGGTSPEDRRDIDWAVAKARKSANSADTSVYEFIRDVLTLDILEQPARRYRRHDIIDAALRFQQYTGPVMAKAVEDTAFYRYVPLVSLNDVGGEPDRFGVSPAAFHELNRRRLHEHPFSMLATATHDHKRGEDVRARLNVLSEIPAEWLRRVRRWAMLNKRKRRQADDAPAPSRNDEYLFYQTLVGAWPYTLEGPAFDSIEGFCERLVAYTRKAAREAKLQTSWAAPNADYETALLQFVTETLDPKLSRPFLDDVFAFVRRIAAAGALNGIAQTTLKLTCPGVPDIYQGCEQWDMSLVDPDNRRPVDYASRALDLAATRQMAHPGDLLAGWQDGRFKQYLTHRVLGLRAERPALFTAADYQAIEVDGSQAHRVLAFARIGDDGGALLVVVPRLVWSLLRPADGVLPHGWGDTRLQVPAVLCGRDFSDCLANRRALRESAGTLSVAQLLGAVPVGVFSA